MKFICLNVMSANTPLVRGVKSTAEGELRTAVVFGVTLTQQFHTMLHRNLRMRETVCKIIVRTYDTAATLCFADG